MRRHRLMALAGLLVLGGCSGDDPSSLGPVPTAPTTSTTTPTTTLPVTSTAPATTSAPATTVRPATTTTTTAGPRPGQRDTPGHGHAGPGARRRPGADRGHGLLRPDVAGGRLPAVAGGRGRLQLLRPGHPLGHRHSGGAARRRVHRARHRQLPHERHRQSPAHVGHLPDRLQVHAMCRRRAGGHDHRRPVLRRGLHPRRRQRRRPDHGHGDGLRRGRGRWSARPASRPCPSAGRRGWRSTASSASRRPRTTAGACPRPTTRAPADRRR